MKRLWSAPILAVCMMGCIQFPMQEAAKTTKVEASATVMKTVAPEQVNDQNAKEQSLALSAEMDLAVNTPPLPTADKTPKDKK